MRAPISGTPVHSTTKSIPAISCTNSEVVAPTAFPSFNAASISLATLVIFTSVMPKSLNNSRMRVSSISTTKFTERPGMR